MNLKDKRVVVTGAGSGIGLALIERLRARGVAKILAVDLNVEKIPLHGGQIAALVCDLSEPEGTDQVMQKAREFMGGIDLYFANAGFAYYERLGKPDWRRLQRIYSTNVLTPIYTFQKVREMAQGQPFRVVITASAMGFLPIPGYAVYGATKASLVSFAEAVRWELQDPVSLTLLNPIATRTQFFKQAEGLAPTPFPSQTADQVAKAVIGGVEADRANIFPSFIFRMTLLVNRLMPWVGWVYQKQQQWVLQRWSANAPAEQAPRMGRSA